MEFSLNFGHESLNVDIPKKNHLGTLKPQDMEKLSKPFKEVERALSNPIDSNKLENLVSKDDQVVILASDISRPAPSNILLPPIIESLNDTGVKDEQIKIIFGLGVHRKLTEKEKKKLVGDDIYERIECINHDIERCIDKGNTKRGTPISIFEDVLESDFLIATGNLEFHYFAGYSGGAKALAPGVCGRETIKKNHKKFLDPKAKGGQIKGNPVREEIEEIGEMIGIDFMLNGVLNSHKELVKVVAGDVTKAHREGTKYINDMFRREIEEKADIVITSPGGFPKDIDLYQTHKAMENASLAVKDDGIIIIAGECEDGLGEENFSEALLNDNTPQDLIDELEHKFILGRHKASRIANIHLNSEIYLVSNLKDSIKEKLFVNNFEDVNKALIKALEVKGQKAKVLLIPYGVSTLPYYAE